jgi:3-oxoacyl-[acyl-carrier protein] reductase
VDDLTGKVALVTGGSRGIGRETALRLATAGRRAVVIQADVARRDDVDRLIETTRRALGDPQILVNNAGIIRPQALDVIADSDWDELIAANLTSVFLITQRVLPAMRAARWGRIINLSSVAAQLGGVVGPHYAASKAGLHGLTHSYAALLAKEGITANTIAPALIETEMVTSNPRARADLLPVGRFGKIDEVADVVVMLAGNGYITGQTFNVNGGWYMS